MTIWVFKKSEFYFLCGKAKLLKATCPWQTSSCNAFNVMGLRRGSCKLPKGNFVSFFRGAKFCIRLEFLHAKLQKTLSKLDYFSVKGCLVSQTSVLTANRALMYNNVSVSGTDVLFFLLNIQQGQREFTFMFLADAFRPK